MDLKGVHDAIDNELTRFTDQIFSFFTGSLTVSKMNYEMFTAFARAAPIVVDWLTELGKFLDQQVRATCYLLLATCYWPRAYVTPC